MGSDRELSTQAAAGNELSTPVAHDWRPSDRVYRWAEKYGLQHNFVDAHVEEFVRYWVERGEVRASWDDTYINRLKAVALRAAAKQRRPRAAGKDWVIEGKRLGIHPKPGEKLSSYATRVRLALAEVPA